MSAAKQEVEALLDKLPDDCTLEDVQYRLYVLEKIQPRTSFAELSLCDVQRMIEPAPRLGWNRRPDRFAASVLHDSSPKLSGREAVLADPREGASHAREAMRVLAIDDSPEYLELIRKFLRRNFAGVEITGYRPQDHGGRVPRLDQPGFDVVLLDHDLGLPLDGLKWLDALKSQRNCPAGRR